MVDPEQVKNALRRVHANMGCPSCGRIDDVFRTPPPESSGIVPLGWDVDVVPVVCPHCGFVRLHATEILFPNGVPEG